LISTTVSIALTSTASSNSSTAVSIALTPTATTTISTTKLIDHNISIKCIILKKFMSL